MVEANSLQLFIFLSSDWGQAGVCLAMMLFLGGSLQGPIICWPLVEAWICFPLFSSPKTWSCVWRWNILLREGLFLSTLVSSTGDFVKFLLCCDVRISLRCGPSSLSIFNDGISGFPPYALPAGKDEATFLMKRGEQVLWKCCLAQSTFLCSSSEVHFWSYPEEKLDFDW